MKMELRSFFMLMFMFCLMAMTMRMAIRIRRKCPKYNLCIIPSQPKPNQVKFPSCTLTGEKIDIIDRQIRTPNIFLSIYPTVYIFRYYLI